jgi:hypothetical protein
VARARSLIQPLSVDVAIRTHRCEHSARHVINKGEKRLKVRVGRSYEHYCSACAEKFIALALAQLNEVLTQLDVRTVG